MEILVIGNKWNEQECILKFGDNHHLQLAGNYTELKKELNPGTLVFDFLTDLNQIQVYQNFEGVVFINVSKNSLHALLTEVQTNAMFFGFIGLPTFLKREILEVSLIKDTDRAKLETICESLNMKFALVKDQVGLITPRVICMIINEAYFAIQDNIASRSDIDLAMKLGTNYPFGPFEWCEKIGIRNVYELLSAVYESTKDERYKVCDLLKEEAGYFTPSR